MAKKKQKRTVAFQKRPTAVAAKAKGKRKVAKVKGTKLGKMEPVTSTQAVVDQLQGSTQAITKLLSEAIGILSLIADALEGSAKAVTKLKGATKRKPKSTSDVAAANVDAASTEEHAEDEIDAHGENDGDEKADADV